MDPKKHKKKRSRGTIGVGNGALFFSSDSSADSAVVPRINVEHVLGMTVEKQKYLVLSMAPAADVGDELCFHVGTKNAADDIMTKVEDCKSTQRARKASVESAPMNAGPTLPPPQRRPAPPTINSTRFVVALYDFEAQVNDELSMREHDQLELVEEESSEWWKVRNAAGANGVVPAAYVRVLDDIHTDASDARATEPPSPVNPVPPNTSRSNSIANNYSISSISKGSSRQSVALPSQVDLHGSKKSARPSRMPNRARVRTWYDRTGQFKVDAEFLGIKNGSFRLHKTNGMVIDVPMEKMSEPDILLVEDELGRSLRPSLSRQQLRRSSQVPDARVRSREPSKSQSRANEDWFEFFLAAGVDVDNCTRYANAFERDMIDEEVLPDLTTDMLRGIGLREGDIIRVRRHIDARIGRRPSRESRSNETERERAMREDEELARRIQLQELDERSSSARRAEREREERQKADELRTKEREVRRRADDHEREEENRKSAARELDEERRRQDERELEIERELERLRRLKSESRPAGVDAETIAEAVKIVRDREREEEEKKKKADPNSELFDKLEKMKPTQTANAVDPFGPRGPLAPVPVNQSLLQPLIPLQGTGQFVPTGGIPGQMTGMPGQMTGMPGQMTGMPGQMTGMPGQITVMGMSGFMPNSAFGQSMTGMAPQPTGMASQPTGMVPQPTGMVPQPTGMAPQSSGSQSIAPQATGSGQFSAANVFQQMKSGSIGKDANAAPQSSTKYDPLRAQPTGFAAGGIIGAPQPQPTGMQMYPGMYPPGYPGMGYY